MGKRAVIATIMTFFGLCSAAGAADLYQVRIDNAQQAQALIGTGADAVLRIADGYLVLLEDTGAPRLAESGLTFELVARDVDRAHLALGIRHDGSAPEGGELIFREDEVRLYRIDVREAQRLSADAGLAALPERGVRIFHREPTRLQPSPRDKAAMDLEALIALVNRDTLEAYTNQLQAFPNRLTGSTGSATSRDWIFDRLTSYGYDSVYLDSFVATVSGVPKNAQNVIAIKPGTTYPDHQILVTGHRDAVSASPGADDNGSGTVGVLEIARILKDIPTELTFVFALFDGEEQGLLGSYHYAGEAAARGDSIVMVLNMDMVGYMGNTNQVKMYFGADTVWAHRYRTIADSLSTDLIGAYSGLSAQSDHYPFQQEGYDVVFLIEYNFSNVYHTARDSTTYMSFDYMKRIVQASLATAYDADAAYLPTPGVTFSTVDDVPTLVLPVETTLFRVSIQPGPGGTVAPGSPTLHYSFDGSFWHTTPMIEVGGGLYDAPLPGPACNGAVQFYISAAEVTTGTYYFPDPAAPWWATAATSSTPGFSDDFETNTGWTTGGSASAGAWTRGTPVGGGDRGDPSTDFDGSGQCFLTANTDGDSDVDNGTVSLTTPVFDATGGTDALISYARWYSNDFGSSPYEDYMDVFISNNNGSTWTRVERVGPSGPEASGDWYVHSFVVGDFVAPTAQMKMRFDVSDLINGSVVEAGIDAFAVTLLTCTPDYFVIITDNLPEWTAGWAYSVQLEAGGGVGSYNWTDKYGDLTGTGLTLSADGLLGGVPTAGSTSFTAACTDAADSTIERVFALTINPALTIGTSPLPKATKLQPYSHTLAVSGGTGARTWALVGSLAGTGMTFSSAGVLSGSPYNAGTLAITVRVTDAIGAVDEEQISLVVEPEYFCGDMDNSRGEPNVSDLTFFVSFMFRGGPEPPVASAADVNGDYSLSIADLTRLVDFLFRGGSPLLCP